MTGFVQHEVEIEAALEYHGLKNIPSNCKEELQVLWKTGARPTPEEGQTK